MAFRWITLVASLFFSMPLATADWNADEKAVWQLEELGARHP